MEQSENIPVSDPAFLDRQLPLLACLVCAGHPPGASLAPQQMPVRGRVLCLYSLSSLTEDKLHQHIHCFYGRYSCSLEGYSATSVLGQALLCTGKMNKHLMAPVTPIGAVGTGLERGRTGPGSWKYPALLVKLHLGISLQCWQC